jgi:hypothetical protein
MKMLKMSLIVFSYALYLTEEFTDHGIQNTRLSVFVPGVRDLVPSDFFFLRMIQRKYLLAETQRHISVSKAVFVPCCMRTIQGVICISFYFDHPSTLL